jgi:hypothetical protein
LFSLSWYWVAATTAIRAKPHTMGDEECILKNYSSSFLESK